MWTYLEKDGQCQLPAGDIRTSYRYPINTSPGDVVRNPNTVFRKFPIGTPMGDFLYVIFPIIMGIVMFLFLMFTIAYLCFSILRLWYVDTVKPYKMKTLRALGKHRYYLQDGANDGERKNLNKRWKKSLPTLNTKDYDSRADKRRSRKRDSVTPDLDHPPGKKISYTSPPVNTFAKTAKGEGYPHVIDLLEKENAQEVSKFPSQSSQLYTEGHGRSSRIPVPKNRKQEGPWIWNPQWYRKQVVDQKETEKAVVELESKKPNLKGRPGITSRPPTVETVMPPKPVSRSLVVARILSSVSEPDLPVEASLEKEAPLKEPVPQKTNYYTKIPKNRNKTYKQQLMVLRGGPRRDSDQIKELLRQKREKSDNGEK